MSQPCDRCDINTVTMHCLDCNQMFCTDCGNELHSEGESQNHRLNTLTLTKLEHKTESPSSTDSLDILAESLNSIRAFPPVEIAVESESSSTQTSPQPIPVNSEQPAEKVVASWDRKASLRGPRSHQTTYVGRARSTLFDNSELNQLRNEISVKDEETVSNGADNSKSEDKPVESTTTSKSALTAIIESEQQNSNSSTPNEDSPPLTSEPNVQKSPTTSTDSLPTPTTPTPTNTNTSSNNTISSSNSNSNSSPMTAMTSPITSPSQPMKIQPKNASPLSKQNPNLGSSMPNLYMSKSPPVRPVRTGLTSSSESPNKSPIRPHTNVSRTKMDSMPEIGQLSVSVADLRNKLGASIPLNFKPPPNSTIASIAKERPPQNTSETPQEKAPTQPQEKGLPRFAEFTIVENSKNITLKKQFPRVCTVGQVVAWCVKQMENSNEKSHYGLFHKDLLLDSERFLFTFEQLNNKDTLELKVIPDGTDFMIKVTVAELNNVSITLKVDELSSVWTVTQKVIKKLITRNFNWLASIQYGLFCGSDPIEMNENDLIITYKDKIEQVRVAPKIMGVIFKRREGVQENLDLKTTVFCNDAVPFTFDSNEKIDRCVRKFIKHYVLKTQGIVTNAYEYTLAYYPNDMEDTMILIDPNETLSQCGIKEGDSLEFHRRVRDYIVELPGNTITSLTISFDSLTTVQECLSFVSYNFPEIFSGVSQSEWQICVKRDGSLLDPLRTLWSYELENSIVIKRKQYPINIMLGQTQKTITIDYSVPVSTIMPQLWTAFSIFPKKSHEFSMKVLGPDSPIDQSRSLNQQSVSHNSTINIKLIGEPTSGENENKTNIDVNIWEKEVLDPCVLFESDTNKLRAGTLNKLVEFLTSATDTDLYYMQAFLMTFNSFTTPGKLMEKLIQRYHVPVPEFADPSELDQWKKTFQRTIQLRVCNVLRYWLENHWQDFDHDLIQFVVNFVDNLQTDQKNLVGKQINKAVLQRTCGMKTREKAVINTKNFPAIIDKPLKKKDKPITLFDCDELEIARQLTLIDFDYYEKILPIELLNQNWTKKPEKSPYVIDFIQRSSAVSFWVTSLILEPNRVSIRALRYAFLVRVAEHLRNLNNFSGMMAFLGGFNSASISRLKFTKNSLPRKCVETIAELESIMNPSGSFKNYRDALHNSNPPCIPYIGTYLSDLTFIDDGNPNTVQGLINFAKHQLTFGVISELQRYQLVKYQLHSFPQRHSLLKDFPVIDDKALYEISLLREPRNAEKVL